MAPEISKQPHSKKSDLFSFGGVLLNLLTAFKYNETEFIRVMKNVKEDYEELNKVLELLSEVSQIMERTRDA